MSISSVEAGSVRSKRRKVRKAKSDDLNHMVTKSRRDGLRKSKSVQFACDDQGRIIPQEREFTVYLDRSLWWNRQEIQNIQDSCWDIVDATKVSTDCKQAQQELRGLERFLLDARADTADEYRRLVLSALEGLRFRDEKVREAARKVSREAQRRARRTAKNDTREAIRAAMT